MFAGGEGEHLEQPGERFADRESVVVGDAEFFEEFFGEDGSDGISDGGELDLSGVHEEVITNVGTFFKGQPQGWVRVRPSARVDRGFGHRRRCVVFVRLSFGNLRWI